MGVHLLLLSGNLSKMELCNLSQFVLVAICHNPSSGIELQTFNMYVLIQLLKPRSSGQMRNTYMHIYRTCHALSKKLKKVVWILAERREIITVRGQSYVSRLPKYWPPIPLSARRVVLPTQQRRGVHTRREERGMGGQYFGRRVTYVGLPSYSNNLSTWQSEENYF